MKALITLALGLLLTADGFSAAPPNIVLIFIDDLGYADIGPFGNTEARTPHLDKLATQGRKFTSYYATPVCSMSRASLMTGCYNTRISIPGVLFPNAKIGLNLAETTLAEVLKPKGYATMCIGKWHLGDAKQFLPIHQGFDGFFGLPYSNDMGVGAKNQKSTRPPLPLYRDETVIETEPDQSQLTRRYTEEAVKFIKAKKDQPFFLYLPHTMIHYPMAASENFKGKSKSGLLGDTIEEIDWSVGQILTALDELKLADNTLVIFTSDNGPDRRPAPPFRGSKTTNFEGGVREPCLMRWPGKIPAGTTCDQILGNIDLLPTFAKISGATLDPDRIIDGRDVTSLLTEASPAAVRDTHLYFSGGESKLVAIRQGEWKLFIGAENAKSGAAPGTLYNLKTDIGETTDVANAHPDIVARMKDEAEKRDAEIIAHKRPAGKLTEP
jgi:arylsulfatase A-like enzyme